MKRYVKAAAEKWEVYGEYGGRFSRLEDAKQCAKEASKTSVYDYQASVWNIQDGMNYIDYENGKCVRDGWSLPSLKRTNERGKFRVGNTVVEKTIYLKDGQKVIKHNGKIYTIN